MSSIDTMTAPGAPPQGGPALALATALGILADRRKLDARDTLDLKETGRVHLVLSGAVDVFLLDRLGRFPIARCAAGTMISTFPRPPEGMQIIGVPTAGAELVSTTQAAIKRLAAAPEHAPLIDDAWQSWLKSLAVWHPHDGKQISREDTDLVAADVLTTVLARRKLDMESREKQLAENATASSAEFSSRLDEVVELIGTAKAAARILERQTVATAAQRVTRALGLADICLRRTTSENLVEAIGDIARDNRMQFRAVELESDWWRADIGPLIATIGPDDQVCSLIREGNHYLLFAEGKPEIVDDNVASRISPIAYTFYVPLPDGKLTPWRLLKFAFHGTRRDLFNIMATLTVTGLVALATPLALGLLMDPIIPDADRSQVTVIAAFLVLLAIGATSSSIVESIATLRLEAITDNRVQAAVWNRLLNLKTDFFRGFTAGDLANRADSINAMRKMLSSSFATFAAATVSLLFSLALMAFYSWQISLAVAVALGIFGACAYLVGRYVLTYNYRGLELAGNLQGLILQLLGSVAKLRIAGSERSAFLRWLSVYRQSVLVNLKQRTASNRLLVARTMFYPFITVIVLVVIGLHSGDLFAFFRSASLPSASVALISTSDFVSFNMALGQFTAAMMSITRGMLQLAMLNPYLRRVQPILDAEEEPVGKGGRLDRLEGEIELRDVSFRYTPDGPLTLRGISLRVPAGAFVAIVGPSGAGKSSMLRLLLGFDSPESGTIHVDGTDMRLLDMRNLRQQYGVVLQNGRMLAGSIYDNITAGLPRSTDEVMEALRIAALDDYVKTLPMGLHTTIADGGSTLSGGQRQRMMIARAIMRKPRVLIMDEATSALDNVTQRKVVENLRALRSTQIVVAQRLSTIVNADLIYVMSEGRIVESGTYQELMANGPIFSEMIARQTL